MIEAFCIHGTPIRTPCDKCGRNRWLTPEEAANLRHETHGEALAAERCECTAFCYGKPGTPGCMVPNVRRTPLPQVRMRYGVDHGNPDVVVRHYDGQIETWRLPLRWRVTWKLEAIVYRVKRWWRTLWR